MASKPREFTVTRFGVTVCVIVDPAWLRASADLLEDAAQVAAYMGTVGELVAEYTAQLELLDAKYRTWRAQATDRLLQTDPKMAEWKVNVGVNAQPNFLEFKTEAARLTGALEWLRSFHEALRIKASMVRARVEIHRAGASYAGDVGADADTDDHRQPLRVRGGMRETHVDPVEEREDRVRNAMRTKARAGESGAGPGEPAREE